MMSRTHLAIGVAASMAAVQPQTPIECAAAVTCGALGAVLCDIDMLWKTRMRDVLSCLLTVSVIVVALLLADHFMQLGAAARMAEWVGQRWIAGAALFSVLCVFGFFAEHRSFTHSLLGLTLFSGAVYMLIPQHSLGFIVGYASHILLDLMNKKPLRLMYPFKHGYCWNWCYASGRMNTLLLWIGMAASVVMVTGSLVMWVV